MSVEAMTWALQCQLVRGTDKLVLVGIANHADNRGNNAWPGIDTLCVYASVKRRAVQDSIANLTDLGLLRVTVNGGGDRRTRADRRPNLYELIGMHERARRGSDGVQSGAQRGARSHHDGVHHHAPEPSLTVLEPSPDRPLNMVTSAPADVEQKVRKWSMERRLT